MFVGGKTLDKMAIPVLDDSDVFTAEGTHEKYNRTLYVTAEGANEFVFALAGMRHHDIYTSLGIPNRCSCDYCGNLRT